MDIEKEYVDDVSSVILSNFMDSTDFINSPVSKLVGDLVSNKVKK